MLRCRFTLQAEQDLAELATFIAEENPTAAAAMLDLLEAKCKLLSQYPEIGRKRDELFPRLRSFPTGHYLIFYRIEPAEVQIIRILHASRDVAAEFRG